MVTGIDWDHITHRMQGLTSDALERGYGNNPRYTHSEEASLSVVLVSHNVPSDAQNYRHWYHPGHRTHLPITRLALEGVHHQPETVWWEYSTTPLSSWSMKVAAPITEDRVLAQVPEGFYDPTEVPVVIAQVLNFDQDSRVVEYDTTNNNGEEQ